MNPRQIVPPPERWTTKEDFNLESFGDLLGQLDEAGAVSSVPAPANQPENDKKKRFFRFLRLGF